MAVASVITRRSTQKRKRVGLQTKILEHRREEFDIRAAVLYRTNSQSRVFEESMRRAGLQYNIVGGFSFYERMEVRDIIAYLKLALNPNDSIALQRVINSPPRGIGKQTIDEIERRARDYQLTWWETIAAIIEQPENLGSRAISALKSFRSVVNKLAQMAETPDGSSKESPCLISCALQSSRRVTKTHFAQSARMKPKVVSRTYRNWSTQPSIMTSRALKDSGNSSTTQHWFPIRTTTSAMLQ